MPRHGLYLYEMTDKGHTFYTGQCPTTHGLSLLPPDLELRITNFGATNYRDHGYATRDELPMLRTVGDAISFLEEEDVGLFEFEAELAGWGTFGSYDDQECSFVFNQKKRCVELMKRAAPTPYAERLVSRLLESHGAYLTIDDKGLIDRFSSFNDYLERRHASGD